MKDAATSRRGRQRTFTVVGQHDNQLCQLGEEQFIGSTTLFIEAIGSVDLRVPQPQRAICLDGEFGCTLILAWSAESAYLLPSYS